MSDNITRMIQEHKNKNFIPWVEKYRPNDFDEIVLEESSVWCVSILSFVCFHVVFGVFPFRFRCVSILVGIPARFSWIPIRC